jgi:hypothetical protein
MIFKCYVFIISAAILSLFQPASNAAAEPMQQTMQLRAGGYFPASKAFDSGTGIDLGYSIRPFSYAEIETGIGYFRAENGASTFISAIPVTVSLSAILPLPYVNLHAGGGIGLYYKMVGGTTELPADNSELSVGYQASAGIEFPTSSGISLLLDGKYVIVDQGKFKSYGIKHDGAFLYGGFAVNF